MRPLIPILLAMVSLSTRAQEGYTAFKNDPAQVSKFSEEIDKRYQADLKSLEGPNRKQVSEIFTQRWKDIKWRIAQEEILLSDRSNAYLQSVVKQIIDVNPTLQDLNPRVVFSRVFWPNASSLGEGTILINIGLFHKLQNESQLAFVLCHELAHLKLNHSNSRIHEHVRVVNSPDFQSELKRIRKSDYQKGQQLEALLKPIAFDSHRHSRDKETEADALAMELLKNTSYDLKQALEALELLDTIDQDKYNVAPALSKHFNAPEYPFQPKWVRQETSLLAGKEKVNQKEIDSLKTHPDCSTRVSKVRDFVNANYSEQSKAFVVDEKTFAKLRLDFDYEIIEYCYNSDRVSRALYFTLQMLDSYPEDVYLNTMIGKCLNTIYRAQKDHVLSKITDLPSPYHEEKYNQFLQFIQNLRLQEIANINYHFMQRQAEKFEKNEDFLFQLIHACNHAQKNDKKDYYLTSFQKQFPHTSIKL